MLHLLLDGKCWTQAQKAKVDTIRMKYTYIRTMKTKLTLSVDSDTLAKARRMLQRRKRTISAEVDAMLKKIAGEVDKDRPLWSERFGYLSIPLDMAEAESDGWYGKHLRKTGAYRAAKRAQAKKQSKK